MATADAPTDPPTDPPAESRSRTQPGRSPWGLPAGLVRSSDDRVVAGVCGGIGAYLGVDPVVVRLVAVVLTVANGIGLAAYLLAWAVLPETTRGEVVRRPLRVRTTEQALALGLLTLGLLLLLRESGLLLPDRLVWPVALAAVGFGLVWARSSDLDRERWREVTARLPGSPTEALRGGRALVLRAVLGAVLVVAGIGTLLAVNEALAATGQLVLAVLATAVGVALLLGPWILRLWRDLVDERRERIRSEERAEMAAHLHDSVLQTLALIQRHADIPARARTLARRQERELRGWLYGARQPSDGPRTLAVALDALASEIEARHDVAVEVVAVGDCALDERVEALVAAVREGAVNAARHSGAGEVSVYVEVEPDLVTAFVRDRGRGFDPATVPPERLGISQSIVGRMVRHGGRAEVASSTGEGTEVTVEVPRR